MSLTNQIKNNNETRLQNTITNLTEKYGPSSKLKTNTENSKISESLNNNNNNNNNNDYEFRLSLFKSPLSDKNILIKILNRSNLYSEYGIHSLLLRQIEFFRKKKFEDVFAKLLEPEHTSTYIFADLNEKAFQYYLEFFYLRKLDLTGNGGMNTIDIEELIKCAYTFRDIDFVQEIFKNLNVLLWNHDKQPSSSKTKNKDISADTTTNANSSSSSSPPPSATELFFAEKKENWNFFRVLLLLAKKYKFPEKLQTEFAKNMLFGDTFIPKKRKREEQHELVSINDYDSFFKIQKTAARNYTKIDYDTFLEFVKKIVIPMINKIDNEDLWIANYSKFESFFDSLILCMLREEEDEEKEEKQLNNAATTTADDDDDNNNNNNKSKWREMLTNEFPIECVHQFHLIEKLKSIQKQKKVISLFDMLVSHIMKTESKETGNLDGDDDDDEDDDNDEYEEHVEEDIDISGNGNDNKDKKKSNNNNNKKQKQKKIFESIDLQSDSEEGDDYDEEEEEGDNSFIASEDDEDLGVEEHGEEEEEEKHNTVKKNTKK